MDAAKRSQMEQDARARLASQIPDSEKIPLSHYVIDNSGSLAEMQRRVDAIFAELHRAAGNR
jgi:dephospho-CoA kinase